MVETKAYGMDSDKNGWLEQMGALTARANSGGIEEIVCYSTREDDKANNFSATETIGFSHTQGIDAQPSTTAFPTLRREGNGHAVALVVYPIDTRNALRDPEKKDAVNRQGLGVGKAGDPSSTLTSLFVPAVAVAEEEEMQTYPTLSASNNPSRSPQSPSVAFPIQGTTIGRSDTAGPQGRGFGENGDPMYTIDTVSGHGVATPTTVRRLTPMECERLQGFPDGWSAQRIDHKKGIVVDQADSSRYKQMGNAVAVPVVEWIFNRLVLSEETK